MDSNKHDAMEQNEEHIQMNNLIYGTLKTELRDRDMAWWRMLEKIIEKELVYFESTLNFQIQI